MALGNILSQSGGCFSAKEWGVHLFGNLYRWPNARTSCGSLSRGGVLPLPAFLPRPALSLGEQGGGELVGPAGGERWSRHLCGAVEEHLRQDPQLAPMGEWLEQIVNIASGDLEPTDPYLARWWQRETPLPPADPQLERW